MTREEFNTGWHHVHTIDVAWSDMDALNHVNNARYFTYMESARVVYLRALRHLDSSPLEQTGPILAYIDCQFIRPLTFPDVVLVGTRITAIGNTSLTMEQAIFSTKLGLIAASGKSVIVLVHYQTGEKVRIPDTVRSLLEG